MLQDYGHHGYNSRSCLKCNISHFSQVSASCGKVLGFVAQSSTLTCSVNWLFGSKYYGHLIFSFTCVIITMAARVLALERTNFNVLFVIKCWHK